MTYPLMFFDVLCRLLRRLVNENEVKQWRDQAEKFRKGKTRVWI